MSVTARVLDETTQALVLQEVLNRTQLGAFGAAVAHFDAAADLDQRAGQSVLNGLVRIQAFGCETELRAVGECGPEQHRCELLDIDIRQHDRRVVATQLQRQSLEIPGRALHALAAGRSRAGRACLRYSQWPGT